MKTRSPLRQISIAALALAGMVGQANAESVVFSGFESSSASSYSYLGGVTPFKGEQLGQGWYQKVVLSMIKFSYESDERGRTELVNGRVPGIEVGVGRSWQFDQRTLDLSASIGYRHVWFKPFVPRDEDTGGTYTLTPQLMASTPLVGKLDADLLANYAIGLETSYVRARVGAKTDKGWRIGIEGKRLQGNNFLQQGAGAFIAIPLRDKFLLELNAGRIKPRDDDSEAYAGIAFSVVF